MAAESSVIQRLSRSPFDRIASQRLPPVTWKGGVLCHGAGWFDNPRPFRYFRCMEPFIDSYGYPALFALSFLASTLIPLGSEWLLAVMLIKQSDPLMTVAVATIGNTLGACTTWAIGLYGGPFLIRRVLRIDEAAQESAERLYRRYGVWSLLFSWLPVIGDPLSLLGGILKVCFGRFFLLVFTGKLTRYAVLAWLTLGGMQIFKF
jgi:membrane protein YqaA with SNARE-associated domain